MYNCAGCHHLVILPPIRPYAPVKALKQYIYIYIQKKKKKQSESDDNKKGKLNFTNDSVAFNSLRTNDSVQRV